MIENLALFCNVKFIKFQKRDNKHYFQKEYNSPHPNPENSYGKTYGDHREFLEFSINQHKKLVKYCKKIMLIIAVHLGTSNLQNN